MFTRLVYSSCISDCGSNTVLWKADSKQPGLGNMAHILTVFAGNYFAHSNETNISFLFSCSRHPLLFWFAKSAKVERHWNSDKGAKSPQKCSGQLQEKQQCWAAKKWQDQWEREWEATIRFKSIHFKIGNINAKFSDPVKV